MKQLPPLSSLKKNTDLNLHPIQGANVRSLYLDPILQSRRMIDKADLSLQAGMTNADIDHGQGANHTQGPKDLHCIERHLGGHAQRTDNHATGGENPHLTPQTGGQD